MPSVHILSSLLGFLTPSTLRVASQEQTGKNTGKAHLFLCRMPIGIREAEKPTLLAVLGDTAPIRLSERALSISNFPFPFSRHSFSTLPESVFIDTSLFLYFVSSDILSLTTPLSLQ